MTGIVPVPPVAPAVPPVAVVSAAPAPVVPVVPDWLPEKFAVLDANGGLDLRASAEKQAAANKHLEGEYTKLRQGIAPVDPGAPVVDPVVDPAAPAPVVPDGTPISRAQAHYAEHQALSDELYAELDAGGISREMVDNYIAGGEASTAKYESSVHNLTGGADSYAAMTKWAGESLTAAETDAFNAVVGEGDLAKTTLAVRGLMTQYTAARGSVPNLVEDGGNANANTIAGYQSNAEMRTDMSNPRYATDPAFRDSVARRLAASHASIG